MIGVVDKEVIRRLYFVQGKSIRWIAKELKKSRKTVRKAIADPGEPKYNLTLPKPQPVLGTIRSIVKQWLEEEKKENLKKQRYTASGIYKLLVEKHDYRGSESSVRRLLAELRQKEKEAYIPLSFEPGSNAQCDWGEAYIYLNEEYAKVQIFCMRLTSCRKSFVMAFPHQRQEAFFEGHVHAFDWFGGVPLTITYDNLKTAVLKVLQGRTRQEQTAFISFRSHYLFKSIFCNTGRGNEKGQVENLVGYALRNFFTPIPRVDSIAELNETLLLKCRKHAESHKVPGTALTIEQAWEEEKKALLTLPPKPYDCFRYAEVRVANNLLVRFENNFYSVPSLWVGRNLTIKAYVYRVEIYGNRQLVATHPRSYGKGEEAYNLDHYLDTLAQKPGALENAKTFQQANLPAIYHQYLEELRRRHPRPDREFVQILLLHRAVSWDILTRALVEAHRDKAYHLEGIRYRVEKLSGKHIVPAPLPAGKHPHLESFKVEKPGLGHFDQLLIGRNGGVVH